MNRATTENRNLDYWWFPLLFGTIFVLIGIWILLAPKESMETLAKVIGVIILVSGTTQLFFSISNRNHIPAWGFQLAGGVIDLAIGIILIVNPLILLKIITFFVSFWLIVNSVTLFLKAGDSRKMGQAYWRWELGLGILLLVIALLFLWHPLIIGITIALWTSLAFIFLGIFRIILTIRLRKRDNAVRSQAL